MLYFGPETYLPLASIIAGSVGVVLTFWRRVAGTFRRVLYRRARVPRRRTPPPSGRHTLPS